MKRVPWIVVVILCSVLWRVAHNYMVMLAAFALELFALGMIVKLFLADLYQ